jgi:DNA-binding response OmpR family regulator
MRHGHSLSVTSVPDPSLLAGLPESLDLAILDWMLGCKTHGGEVARQIRSVSPRTRVLIISGYPDAVAKTQAEYSDCIDATLEKPFRLNEFLDAVNRLLKSAEVER